MTVRQSILDAGVALLKDKGVAALTQPQVARAAGIKQSHLTYYYPTCADLLLAIAEYSIAATLERFAERLAGHPAPATVAGQIAEVMIDGLPPRLIVGLIVAADAEPKIRCALTGFIAHVRARLQQLLAAAGVAADSETTLLAHATLVGLSIMHQARLSDESESEVRCGIAALMQRLAAGSVAAADGGACS